MLRQISTILEDAQVSIELINCFLSTTCGLLHILIHSLMTDSNQGREQDGGESDTSQALSNFLIELCNLILVRFNTLLSNDFQVLESRYEPFLGLVKLVVRVLNTDYMYKIMDDESASSSLQQQQQQQGDGGQDDGCGCMIEVRKNLGRCGTLVARLVGERYPGGDTLTRPRLQEEIDLVGCVFVKESVLDDSAESGGSATTCFGIEKRRYSNVSTLRGDGSDEGDEVRIRCNQILYGIRKLCREEVCCWLSLTCVELLSL